MSRVPSSVTRLLVASVLLAGLLVAGTASAATDAGSINFILGRKSLSSDWYLGPPIVDAFGVQSEPGRAGQPALGVALTWGKQEWPAMIAFDVLHSYDDGITRVPAFFSVPAYDQRLRASTTEIALGVRRAFTVFGFSPYLGAGGSWVRGNAVVEISDPDSSQFGVLTAAARARTSAFGYWAGGGIYRRIGPRFQIGVEGRYSKATLPATELVLEHGTLPFTNTTLDELDGGGRHVNLVVGWSFPSRK